MAEAIFYAVFTGIALGVLYDFFRLMRFVFNSALFFDLLFWFISAFVCFSFLLVFNNGSVRGIYFVSMFAGYMIYILSAGKITLNIEKAIAKKVKIWLKKVKKSLKSFKKVLQLPYSLYYNIKVTVKNPFKNNEGEECGKQK